MVAEFRFAAGVTLPPHTHHCTAMAYTISGEWSYDGRAVPSDSLAWELPDSSHTPVTETGAELLVILTSETARFIENHMPDWSSWDMNWCNPGRWTGSPANRPRGSSWRSADMDVERMDGRTAVVTGAGSGIGRETALLCARHGASLALCDVDEGGMAETESAARASGRDVLTQRVDVGDREQMRAFADTVHERFDAVDLLVNNAGVGLGAHFLDTPLEDWDWIVPINIMGVVHGCHFFVPAMVDRGRGGHVVNLSSAAGFFANPSLSAYTATKFAVLGLSEALRVELRPHRIGVTAVCPGLINTPITRTSRLRGPQATEESRARFVRLYERRNYGPDRVAKRILHAVQRDRAVMPVTAEAWAMYGLARLAPPLARQLTRALDAATS